MSASSGRSSSSCFRQQLFDRGVTTEWPYLMAPEPDPEVLVVWDSSDDPPEGVSCAVWEGFKEGPLHISLLRQLERGGERFRARCLEWVDGVGDLMIDDERLVERLIVDPGLSYWPMIVLSELNYLNSRAVLDVLRLLVLEEVLDELRPSRVQLVTSRKEVGRSVEALCLNRGISSEWEGAPTWIRRLRRRVVIAFSRFRDQVIAGRSLIRTRPLKRARSITWPGGSGSVFICTYDLAGGSSEDRDTDSYARYWGGLPEALSTAGRTTNWLHIFLPSEARSADDAVDSMLTLRARGGNHMFVQSWVGWRLLVDTLLIWCRLRRSASPLKRMVIEDTGLDRAWLWPLVSDDLVESIVGPTAYWNLLIAGLFDRSLSEMPHQETGLFLFENQSWEPALVHAWRKYGHGRLIGVAHTTTRFWDLRYFMYPDGARPNCPIVDEIVVNGPEAVLTLKAAGVEGSRILEAEALRFSALEKEWFQPVGVKRAGLPLRVLALGDYVPESTDRMLRLLAAVISDLAQPVLLSFRPHPNNPINPSDYTGLDFEMTDGTLSEALQHCDVVVGGDLTTAVIEPYVRGVPTVVVLDDQGLNFSPLRDIREVDFVSDIGGLAAALTRGRPDRSVEQLGVGHFFHLDSSLARWRGILCL